ncbi:hypothetical protein [Nocardia transvalensis]|uniref:hypothetical protein n=1 Tax=Nocardia transvalensis TaxID=37333 RepID=UPI00189422A8|nr:hypothetical protein [Nocardia transvalensis]MBF6329340.1 hypothetical protein [Nocardia transvalensis]
MRELPSPFTPGGEVDGGLPLLGFLLLMDRIEDQEHYTNQNRWEGVAKVLGMNSGAVGVVAAFWHIHWIFGVLVTASGAFGCSVWLVMQARPYPTAVRQNRRTRP